MFEILLVMVMVIGVTVNDGSDKFSVVCVLQESSRGLLWMFEKILLVMVMVMRVTVNDGNVCYMCLAGMQHSVVMGV